MATASCTTSISNEKRRWVVIGVCLTNVLTPVLRNVLATEMPKWHHALCQPPTEIDKQVYVGHKIQLNPSTLDLNYKNINNNDVHKSPRLFDYAVKDPLSLTQLFVKPFMCKFTSFDTMDISAVLSVICEAAPFTAAARKFAKDVRLCVRNEWAHCADCAHWTDIKFCDAFQMMENLLKNVNLSDEKEWCDELKSWKEKGNEILFYGRTLYSSQFHLWYSCFRFINIVNLPDRIIPCILLIVRIYDLLNTMLITRLKVIHQWRVLAGGVGGQRGMAPPTKDFRARITCKKGR